MRRLPMHVPLSGLPSPLARRHLVARDVRATRRRCRRQRSPPSGAARPSTSTCPATGRCRISAASSTSALHQHPDAVPRAAARVARAQPDRRLPSHRSTSRRVAAPAHVVLHVAGAESVHAVYVNGEFAGYGTDSRLPSEYDVTDCVAAGRRTSSRSSSIRYSAHSYIEDQDQWWMAGLHRSVWVEARPQRAHRRRPVRRRLRRGERHRRLVGCTTVVDFGGRRLPAGSVRVSARPIRPGGASAARADRTGAAPSSLGRTCSAGTRSTATWRRCPTPCRGVPRRRTATRCSVELLDPRRPGPPRTSATGRLPQRRGPRPAAARERSADLGVRRQPPRPPSRPRQGRHRRRHARRPRADAARTTSRPSAPRTTRTTRRSTTSATSSASTSSTRPTSRATRYNTEPVRRRALPRRVARPWRTHGAARPQPPVASSCGASATRAGTAPTTTRSPDGSATPTRPARCTTRTRIPSRAGSTAGGRRPTSCARCTRDRWRSASTAQRGPGDRPLIMCEYSHAMGNANGSLADYWDVDHHDAGSAGWVHLGVEGPRAAPAAARRHRPSGLRRPVRRRPRTTATSSPTGSSRPTSSRIRRCARWRGCTGRSRCPRSADGLRVENRQSFRGLSDLRARLGAARRRRGRRVRDARARPSSLRLEASRCRCRSRGPPPAPTRGMLTVRWTTIGEHCWAPAGHLVAWDQIAIGVAVVGETSPSPAGRPASRRARRAAAARTCGERPPTTTASS